MLILSLQQFVPRAQGIALHLDKEGLVSLLLSLLVSSGYLSSHCDPLPEVLVFGFLHGRSFQHCRSHLSVLVSVRLPSFASTIDPVWGMGCWSVSAFVILSSIDGRKLALDTGKLPGK